MDECLICDNLNNYFLVGESCYFKKLENNCLQKNQKGECSLCVDQHYLNENKICTPIPFTQ